MVTKEQFDKLSGVGKRKAIARDVLYLVATNEIIPEQRCYNEYFSDKKCHVCGVGAAAYSIYKLSGKDIEQRMDSCQLLMIENGFSENQSWLIEQLFENWPVSAIYSGLSSYLNSLSSKEKMRKIYQFILDHPKGIITRTSHLQGNK